MRKLNVKIKYIGLIVEVCQKKFFQRTAKNKNYKIKKIYITFICSQVAIIL